MNFGATSATIRRDGVDTKKAASAEGAPDKLGKKSAEDQLLTKEVRDFHDFKPDELATWTFKRAIKPRAAVRPFERDRCLETLAKAFSPRAKVKEIDVKIIGDGWFDEVGAISPVEAQFWFAAIHEIAITQAPYDKKKVDAIVDAMRGQTFKDSLDHDAVVKVYTDLTSALSEDWALSEKLTPLLIQLTRSFIGAASTLKLAIEIEGGPFLTGDTLDSLGPIADDEAGAQEQADVVSVAKDIIDKNYFAGDVDDNVSDTLVMLRCTLDDALIESVFTRMLSQPEVFRWNDAELHGALHALRDDQRFVELMKQSTCDYSFQDVIRLMVRGGFETLAWSSKRLSKHALSRGETFENLCRIHSRHLVEQILTISSRGGNPRARKTAERAEAWILAEGANAIAGLLPSASRRGKAGEYAATMLRAIAHRGGTEMIRSQVDTLPERTQKFLREALQLESSEAATTAADAVEWPAWAKKVEPPRGALYLATSSYPRVRTVGGAPLSPAQAGTLVAWISRSHKDPSLLPQVRELVSLLDPASFGGLVDHLVEGFIKAGMPTTQRWTLWSIAIRGDAPAVNAADRLLALLGEGALKQFQQVLAPALAESGSPEAIWKLAAVATKDSGWAENQQATTAQKQLKEIAEKQNVSVDALVDSASPLFGLSAHGTLSLNYGSREMIVTVTSPDEIRIQEKDGQVFKTLPPAKSGDDNTLVDLAHLRYRTMAACVRQYFTTRRARVLDAMTSLKKWQASHWRERWVAHPLDGFFARGQVWGIVNRQGLIESSFRATEDGTLTDADDTEFHLPDAAMIRLVHPLDLEPSLRNQWSSQLNDYRVLQPVEQISRRAFTTEEANTLSFDNREIAPNAWASIRSHRWVQISSELYRCEVAKGLALDLTATQGWDNELNRWAIRFKSATIFVEKGDRDARLAKLSQLERVGLSEAALDLQRLLEQPLESNGA